MTKQLPGCACPTCGRPWSPADFYDSAAECRPCKRDRSKQNRLIAARKIALAERLVDSLVELAKKGWIPVPHLVSTSPTEASPATGPHNRATEL